MRAIAVNGLGLSPTASTVVGTRAFMSRAAGNRAFAYSSTGCSPDPRTASPAAANRIFDVPRVTVGYPRAALGGLGLIGDHLLCPEVDDVVLSVKAAVMKAQQANGDASTISEAQAYIARHSGFGSSVLIGSEACQNAVNVGKQLVQRLSGGGLLDKVFGNNTPNVNVNAGGGSTGSFLEALGSLKTIAIAGAVVAGVVLVAPVVWRMVR